MVHTCDMGTRLATQVRARTVHAVLAALAALAAVAVLAAALVPPAIDAAAVGAAATPGSAFVVRSGHVPYENCRASDVTLTVRVARHAFIPGQLVRYAVTLRNDSAHACSAPHAGLVHGPLSFVLGPCSPVSVHVVNASGVDVYPGDVSLSCPAIIGEPIPPHHSIFDAGTWDQRSGSGVEGVQQPPGIYTLVFDGKVRVPVRLALGPRAVPVPVPTVVPFWIAPRPGMHPVPGPTPTIPVPGSGMSK